MSSQRDVPGMRESRVGEGIGEIKVGGPPTVTHMLDATMRNYITPVLCIITMLLCNLWVIERVESFNFAIANLVDMLQDQAEESQIMQQIHTVLIKM